MKIFDLEKLIVAITWFWLDFKIMDEIKNENKNRIEENKVNQNDLDISQNKILDNNMPVRRLSITKKKRIYKSNVMKDIKRDIILNKDIDKIIEFKKEPRKEVKLNKSERFFYSYCYIPCTCGNTKVESESKTKYEILNSLNYAFANKTNIVKLLKMIDQLRLLRKIILNEEQCFMLQNRGSQTIINKRSFLSNMCLEQINEVKDKVNAENLAKYLDTRNVDDNLSSIDLLLLKYMDPDVKFQVLKQMNSDKEDIL